MNESEEVDTFIILQLWRDALKTALCVKEFHIEGDGKTFDYDLKNEKEYNCDDCKAEFCFKSLEWINECGDGAAKNKLHQATEVEMPENREAELWERAYT